MASKSIVFFVNVENIVIMCLLVEQLLSQAHTLCGGPGSGQGSQFIDKAIHLCREALALCTPGHPRRAECLYQLPLYLHDRYNRFGEVESINEAIAFSREGLMICQPGDPHRAMFLTNLAVYLCTRFSRVGCLDDINESITLDRDALALCPQGHPARSGSLNNLAISIYTRYRQLGGIEDLNEAIVLDQEALALRPLGHLNRCSSLNYLALHIYARFGQLGRVDDLDEAVLLGREALTLCPGRGSRNRSMFLHNLGLYLSTRFRRLGKFKDLNEAITLNQDALALCPPTHPDRPSYLDNLANLLWTRYGQLGAAGDLDKAIITERDALALRPPGHPGRSMSLNNLAAHLFSRYMQFERAEDLDEVILLGQNALALRPPGHPHRSASVNNLAHFLYTRYLRFGGIKYLDEAIVLSRETLVLCPEGHPQRPSGLINLAIHLTARYKQLKVIEDLDEAIASSQDGLATCHPEHVHRPQAILSLAILLSSRYDMSGRLGDLDDAILLERDALALRPPGHPDRYASLTNLGSGLGERYRQLGNIEDFNEAHSLYRDALVVYPPGHPHRFAPLNNLADLLCARYHRLGEVEDLDTAIVFDRDALALCLPGNQGWSTTLSNFSVHLTLRYKQLGEAEDLEKIFCLYNELACVTQTVSSFDVSVVKAWVNAAEEFHHPTILLAYETALRLLVQHIATLPSLPQHLAILKDHTSSLAVDAFSAHLRGQSPTRAVELLEQGRGVFWSQLARLRSPLADVIASGSPGKTLADEFTRITWLIRGTLNSPSSDQHDRACNLNTELQRIISHIRELPGLSHFLLPSPFADLRRAASGGPVIIVNASKYGCDALVVFVDKDPVHIPLSVSRHYVRSLSSELHVLIKRTKRVEVTNDLRLFLRNLWDKIVSPIVKTLQEAYPSSRQSRIWWCPTAEFSLLPLHAANPYRKDQKGLSGLYTSSYTPTLAALIRARQQRPPNPARGQKCFLAIGQANAAGTSELCSVGSELTHIGQRVNELATFTRMEGEESCISKVAEELVKNEWVHFACHGIPNRKQPFESAFALHDGRLTIQRIIQYDLENPEFAYLSACHTTVGDEEGPDEVIHLAAAMQFAGFRSVIGTMWAVDDAETNKISSVFYKHMIDDLGRLDHTRAASALRETMRSVKVPLDQRILYIHLGI